MTSTTRHNPIAVLNPISEIDNVNEVSRETWAALAEAIVATPPRPPRGPRRRDPGLRGRRPAFRLAVAMAAAVAVLAGATGVLSDQGPTGAAPADAAILRGANAALHPTGAIVLETESFVAKDARGHTLPSRFLSASHWSGITETPMASGPQNELVLDLDTSAGVQSGWLNGNNELYDPARNVVYFSSNYGPDITPGTTPGTYIYTFPKLSNHAYFRLPEVPMGADSPPPPLTITAAQALQLRRGSAEVWVRSSAKHQSAMSIHPAFRVPTESASARAVLGTLKVVGSTTVDGRRAIKLVPIRGTGEYDVAPGTYYPIREVVQDSSGVSTITTWSEYRVLPAIPANEQLLNLMARHPGAHVDHSRADFIAAYARLNRGH